MNRIAWIVGFMFVGAASIAAYVARPLPRLQVYSQIQNFSLTNQEGQPVDESIFQGKTSVVDFFFTECQGQCLLMSKNLEQLSQRLAKEDVQYVSISVDPKTDTPAALADYAKRFTIPRWQLLTGDADVIKTLSEKSFLLAASPDAGPDLINHSSRFILVDHMGQVRGYWDGVKDEAFREIPIAIEKLKRERKS